MHKWAKQIMECVKGQVDGIGLNNFDVAKVEELKAWTCVAKDIAEMDYYVKIIEAMEESEYGEDYDWQGRMYYTPVRSKTSGRYMSRDDGRRRGYVEMPYDLDDYSMNVSTYRNKSPRELRDMDRRMGRMYYTDRNADGGQMASRIQREQHEEDVENAYRRGYQEGNESGRMSGNNRSSMEGRSGMSRRTYMESKKENPQDNTKNMKDLEDYMKELSGDITEMIQDMTPTEKQMMRTKMQTLVQKI